MEAVCTKPSLETQCGLLCSQIISLEKSERQAWFNEKGHNLENLVNQSKATDLPMYEQVIVGGP